MGGGEVVAEDGCNPPGGVCSAQAVDLHSLWMLKKALSAFRDSAGLETGDTDFPVWRVVTPHGVIRLVVAQCSGNVMVATDKVVCVL